ncbi:nucleotidyltransferase substrate binding protein [Salicibibacter kimchii]|uniref:Nucleotidyltransferase n=1 Tax=Salicibibacter kimchii TaxID=2099786 RepID=A0A345C019_9BACI|nr:nucleotidyltransferase substrate binding protein [Salicibibacter kimchii]AXF56550.1 nucleotidyltransferase [Salicibibacter kimchii]
MDNAKEIRWKQRFNNFEISYALLEEYKDHPLETELERAGLIQLFEVTFELAWKVLKDYIEAEGYMVKSPRQTIKQVYQMDLIENGHTWIDALSDRNLTEHTYDEAVAAKLVKNIREHYFLLMEKMYVKLSKER